MSDTQANATPKDYSKLHRTYEYDEEKASLLAEAMTELTALKQREEYLLSLLEVNKGLKRFLWQDGTGKVTAFHDLTDEHLVNILNHLHDNGREITKPMEAEARKRNITLPTEPKLLGASGSTLTW